MVKNHFADALDVRVKALAAAEAKLAAANRAIAAGKAAGRKAQSKRSKKEHDLFKAAAAATRELPSLKSTRDAAKRKKDEIQKLYDGWKPHNKT